MGDFTISNGALVDYTGSDSHVIIPEGITVIGRNAFAYYDSIEHVTIPDGVTSICDGAFSNCSNLQEIIIPDSLKSIGAEAFKGCTKLSAVDVPNGVTDVGDWAFSGTPWLINQGDMAILNGILIEYQGNETTVTIPEGVTCIGNSAFDHCICLQHVVAPEGVVRIGKCAFAGCRNLKSVILPQSVTSIGETDKYAFENCRSIETVCAPGISFAELKAEPGFKSAMLQGFASNPSVYSEEKKDEYRKYVNSQKKKLMKHAVEANDPVIFVLIEQLDIKIAPALRDELIETATSEKKTEVLAWLMDYKNRTTDIKKEAKQKERANNQQLLNPYMAKFLKVDWKWSKLEDGTMQIDKYTGNGTEAQVPPLVGEIPVTSIGRGVFSGNTSLQHIEIPDSITNLNVFAFAGCLSLISIELGKGIKCIPNAAFSNCPKLEIVRIPEGVTVIGENAFSDCSSLRSIVIPEGVTEIQEQAFAHCNNLQNVVFPNSLTCIGKYIFRGCGVPASITCTDTVSDLLEHSNAVCQNLKGMSIVAETLFSDSLKRIIEDFGGSVSKSVTKKTSCLVTAWLDNNRPMQAKAAELGIPIITEEEFINTYFPAGKPNMLF